MIGIAVLGLVVLGLSIFLKGRRTPLVELRYGRHIHFGAAIGLTVLMVVLWLVYDLPIAIIPALRLQPGSNMSNPGLPPHRPTEGKAHGLG